MRTAFGIPSQRAIALAMLIALLLTGPLAAPPFLSAQGPSPLLFGFEKLQADAWQLAEEGRCAEAIPLLRMAASLPGDHAPESLYRLGECYEQEESWLAAAATWEELARRFAGDSRAREAILRAGDAYLRAGAFEKALSTLQRYAEADGPLADIAWEHIGDARLQMGCPLEAAEAYTYALEATTGTWRALGLREKIAQAYIQAQDVSSAAAVYETLLRQAPNPEFKARIGYTLGILLLEQGRSERAYRLFREAVEEAPETDYAYLALIELVEAGIPVDDYLRGLVDYHACAEHPLACGAAVAAFGRYIRAHPRNHKAEAHYYAALAYRTVGNYTASLREWDWLIETHPESELVPEGRWQKARTLALMGRTEEAIALYRETAALHPRSPYAVKALRDAAELLERDHRLREASSLYEDIALRTDDARERADALFRAGLALYRAGDFARAAEIWLKLHEEGDPVPARAAFWLGKAAYAQGRYSEARSRWREAARRAPLGFYGIRAQVRLREFSVAGCTPLPTQSTETAASDEEIAAWLEKWAPAPDAKVSGLCEALRRDDVPATGDRSLIRAEALLHAGYRSWALQLYEAVRRRYADDPHATACLGAYFRRLELYPLSIRCAVSLGQAAESAGAPQAPPALERLAYPLPYLRLLNAEACAAGVDPLFLAALIRQESLFDPRAVSPAGATGLAQIMPSTGELIARATGTSGYRQSDLQKPHLSVKFGMWYLAGQRRKFGDWMAALAAYNGGPGNAARWWREAQSDPDLFVELIDLTETQTYVKRVYEQYACYRRIYRTQTGLTQP